MSCVKHFALNSMENSRFQVDVEVADDVLHEIYLPHFRAVVEALAPGLCAVKMPYSLSFTPYCCSVSCTRLARTLIPHYRTHPSFTGLILTLEARPSHAYNQGPR